MKVTTSIVFIIFQIVATLNFNVVECQTPPVVKVSVFYESLCPDSVRFIGNQLKPAYEHFRSNILLDFVPFGKSYSSNGGEQFTCQHGPAECRGNMIQSCGLHVLQNQDEQMEFVACQMKRGAEPSGRICIESVRRGAYKPLLECFNSPLGRDLQLKAEAWTLIFGNPQLKFVPTIVYNEKFDQNLQDRSLSQFPQVVCEMLGNTLTICKQQQLPYISPMNYVYNFFRNLF